MSPRLYIHCGLGLLATLWRTAAALRVPFAIAAIGVSLAHAQIPVAGPNGAQDFDFGSFTATAQAGVFTFAQNTATGANGIHIQSSGKPIVVSSCGVNPAEDICISRLTRDGTQLDTTFGNAGTARYNGGGQDYGYASALDASERIVVGGSCSGAPPTACVLRFSSNGALDTSFGTSGRAGYMTMSRINTLVIDADGKTVVAGECFSSGTRACVGRLQATGAIDSTFNAGAPLVLQFPSADYQAAAQVALDANGRILLAAYCNSTSPAGTFGRFCVARITAAGALDSTFNGGTPRVYALNTATTDCTSSAIAENAAGQIIVAGLCKDANLVGRFAVSRLTSSGGFDTTFGTDNYAGLSYQWIDRDLFVIDTRVFIDAAGRIVLAGYCSIGFCLARMLPSGRPDPLFADRSVLLYKPEPAFSVWEQTASSAALFDGNRVLLAGTCSRSSADRRTCVTRNYLETPPGERCTLDLDGDGEVSAATDGVLWARWLAGFRGTALTQGAIGPRAQRTSADAVGNYLATHCGVR